MLSRVRRPYPYPTEVGREYRGHGGRKATMAATSNPVRRGTVLPVDAARWAMWTFVIVNVVIVEALFVSAGSGKNGVLTVAKFFGLHAALLMLFQLLLVARLPWLDRRIGMDRLTVWRRRRSAAPAPACATPPSAAAPSSRGRTGRSPRCTGPGPAPC